MTLSTKDREAIKTASAMTIAYGAALYMDFTELKWAGFAVAFVSLATVGQSLNKAALRMAGTLIGVIVALTFIGLFAQSRWLFMVFLSIWPGCCAYMMGGPNNQYLWHVGGFVSVIICMGARRERSGAVSATTPMSFVFNPSAFLAAIVPQIPEPSPMGTNTASTSGSSENNSKP